MVAPYKKSKSYAATEQRYLYRGQMKRIHTLRELDLDKEDLNPSPLISGAYGMPSPPNHSVCCHRFSGTDFSSPLYSGFATAIYPNPYRAVSLSPKLPFSLLSLVRDP
ncbi:hypothetical protein NL676_015542 [Syzygium grande]|nr:hypothetical protein NL676_015542 [Syzygium grande]